MRSDGQWPISAGQGLAAILGLASAAYSVPALAHMRQMADQAMICGARPAEHCAACPAAFSLALAGIAVLVATTILDRVSVMQVARVRRP